MLELHEFITVVTYNFVIQQAVVEAFGSVSFYGGLLVEVYASIKHDVLISGYERFEAIDVRQIYDIITVLVKTAVK